jgi:hypothetical protein
MDVANSKAAPSQELSDIDQAGLKGEFLSLTQIEVPAIHSAHSERNNVSFVQGQTSHT